ncbi:MAG: folate-binding protein [Burkholderiales bacterium]|nr:folate-binding protein [Burkholderiales bacterium]
MTPAPAPATAPAFAFDEAFAHERARALGLSARFDEYGPQAELPLPPRLSAGLVVPLLDLGLLSATGEEAVKFLHAQLTNDVEHLAPGSARWFGYCNAKGRLQASLLGWRADADAVPRVALAISLPLAQTLKRRLSMFVLRAKLKITDDSHEQACFGLAGEAARAQLVALAGSAPGPLAVVQSGSLTVIGLEPVALPDGTGTLPRWLVWTSQTEAAALWARLQQGLSPASGALWRWFEVRSGVARIVAGTWERFVPQMVNFELVGGVDFKKGCYPGQEVVARSQYLGKLKRRMFLGSVAGPAPLPGADVSAPGATDACGEVVMAAPAPDGGIDVLFESQTAAVALGGLSIGGQALTLHTLPYPIPA